VTQLAVIAATVLAMGSASAVVGTPAAEAPVESAVPTVGNAVEPTPPALNGVDITEQLGDRVDLGLTFTDHTGATVRLGDYFDDDKPVLLTLNYYECPMLCTLQLNALVEGLKELNLDGDDFQIVTISIDPGESFFLANSKRTSYLNALDRSDFRWSFLVGDEENIQQVAASVGFTYHYDAAQDNYAHAPAVYFLSPDGMIVRYMYALDYPSQDMKFALMDASNGTIGSTIDRIILSCYHFVDGVYSPFAFGIMRIGGVLTVIVLGGFLIVNWRREWRLSRRAGAVT
jgi:protein SCO1/2